MSAVIAESTSFSEVEWDYLVEFLRDSPGRICAAAVPGADAGEVLCDRLRRALAPMPVVLADRDATPTTLGDRARSLSARDSVLLVRLDGSRFFEGDAHRRVFWEELNFQRESLAAGRVRTCLVLNDSHDRLMIRHADDLREWTRLFRFPEAVVSGSPLFWAGPDRAEAYRALDQSETQLGVLRDQLRRAHDAGMALDVIARNYAAPLFAALVDTRRLGEAQEVFERDLYHGESISHLPDEQKLATIKDCATLFLALHRYELAETWARRWLAGARGRDEALAYQCLSQIRALRGNLRDAIGQQIEAEEIFQALAAREPDHTERQRDLSVSFNKLADLYASSGERERARDYYKQGLAIFQALAAREPEHTERQRDLWGSFNKLADLYASSGERERARDYYEQGLAISRTLAAREPEHTERQRDLSVTLIRLADLYASSGDRERAQDYYEQDLAISQVLAAREPEHTERQRDLSVSFNKLADLYASSGERERARDYYEQGLAISQALAAREPEHTGRQRDLSVTLIRLADLYASSGDRERARDFYEQALAISRTLAAGEPDHTERQRDLSVTLNRLADLYASSGDRERARDYYEQGLAIAQALAVRESDHTDRQRDLAISCERMATYHAESGNVEEARSLYQRSLEIHQDLQRRDPACVQYQLGAVVPLMGLAELSPSEAPAYIERAATILQGLRDSGTLPETRLPWLEAVREAREALGAMRR